MKGMKRPREKLAVFLRLFLDIGDQPFLRCSMFFSERVEPEDEPAAIIKKNRIFRGAARIQFDLTLCRQFKMWFIITY